MLEIRGVLLRPVGEPYDEDGVMVQDYEEYVEPEPCRRFLPSESFIWGI